MGVQMKKADVLSFSLNNEPFIQVFNQICHSFQKYTIYTNDFALYVIKKYKLMIKPPYSLEMIDNDFNEQTFKENDTIIHECKKLPNDLNSSYEVILFSIYLFHI